jgi:DNA-binding LacI/PurR family transcriptional regulator
LQFSFLDEFGRMTPQIPQSVGTTKAQAIADHLLGRVGSKEFTDRMPPLTALASEYGVNFKTVNRAFAILAEVGVVESTRGRGTMILPGAAQIAEGQAAPQTSQKLVAVFMPPNTDLYQNLYNTLVQGINEADHFPIMLHKMDEESLREILNLNPAAIVVDRGWDEFPYALLKERRADVGRVLFLHRYESPLDFDADYVLSDTIHGAYTATRHLAELGHRRILLQININNQPAMDYRHTVHHATVQGYRLALEEAGLAGQEMFHFETPDSAENASRLRDILSGPDRPTAIFADGDFRLVEAMPVIASLGLKVPDDLALVGRYNTHHATDSDPALTSVCIREDELAQAAAKRLMEGGSEQRILMKPKLIIRKSCGGREAVLEEQEAFVCCEE